MENKVTNLQNVSLYGLKKIYEPNDYTIFLKKSWVPNQPVAKDMANLLMPNPAFVSDFLVLEKNKNKLHNVTVKYVNINPDEPKKFNGMARFYTNELKGLLDDWDLYSNIVFSNGKHIRKSESWVVFSAYNSAKTFIYFSKPYSLSGLIMKDDKSYSAREWAIECKDALRKGRYVDNRPTLTGGFENYLDAYKVGDKSNLAGLFSRVKSSSGEYCEYIWNLHHPMDGAWDQERSFPKHQRLKKEEYIEGSKHITEEELNLHVSVIAAETDNKSLIVSRISSSKMEDLYNEYVSTLHAQHKELKYKERKAAQIDWILGKDRNYPILPSYTWFNNCPLYFAKETKIH